ncbi:hypothetical protein [Lacrimispora saccharolytica]|uniref:Uncharacterized protein n=1 Tax=Lacrimispora saccharolytica (strain ATCC 35040 / DSM 2544 / NRCC 2533 / WM1) TaxID=610130 RepID=D9R3B6_LACSW|nr:hypothetical protein [Lacrimispora saccharolytica]ADL04865.1 hypothetical protein Closa_2289 [[Clostridium] saccharolyticum WM1]QRV20927.1 hypothetical protein I6K70_05315 [Lacrimispora saccharolytica]
MGIFGIGTNVTDIDGGELHGRMYHVACKAWFTASCSPRPLSIKFEGDDGMIQTISDIAIKCSEDKNYNGIPSKEFQCIAIIGGIRQEFKLVFYMEACKWVMVI